MRAAIFLARSASTSTTALTRAPLTTSWIRRTWSAPILPGPMTATPRVARSVMVIPSGAAGPQELTGAHRDRQWLVRLARVHVLLDDGEQLHAELLRGHQDRLQLGYTGRRFAHHSALDGRAERHLVLDDVREDLRVDLLEVEVADPLAVRLDELDAVAAAVGVVPGVQTEVDEFGVRRVQEVLDVVLGVEGGVGVRGDDEFESVRLLDLVAEPFHALGQVRPLLVGQLRRLEDLGGLVVAPEGRDDDEMPGPHGLGERGDLADVLPGRLPHRGAAVQPGEDRARRDLEVAPGDLVGQSGGVGRQIAVRPQLDPGVARLGDLVQEAFPRHLHRVVGEPDAPGVRGRADADTVEWGRHLRTSPRRWRPRVR